MSGAKHTSGTWAVGHAGFERRPVVVAKRAGRPVTVASFDSGKREDDESNARLTAAAPDMMKALQSVLKWYGGPTAKPEEWSACMLQARDAIAKAEGGAS